MLTINNPDDAEKRQNVKPLTVEEEYMSISFIHNLLINLKFIGSEAVLELVRQVKEGEQIKLLQRLIHNYENYRHFFEVVGGWDGLSKLQEDNDKLKDFINTLRFHNVINEDANQILNK